MRCNDIGGGFVVSSVLRMYPLFMGLRPFGGHGIVVTNERYYDIDTAEKHGICHGIIHGVVWCRKAFTWQVKCITFCP